MKALLNVFVVVPSSKLSPTCVDKVRVELEKEPYWSLKLTTRKGIEFVTGSVTVPDRVRLSISTISAGELMKAEAIALFECDGFWIYEIDLGFGVHGDGGNRLKGWLAGSEPCAPHFQAK